MEAIVSLASGLVAGIVALVGFGVDSGVEVTASAGLGAHDATVARYPSVSIAAIICGTETLRGSNVTTARGGS